MVKRWRQTWHRPCNRPHGREGGRRDRLPGCVRDDTGMTTAEYAVGTVAACAFAAVLLKVVSGHEVLTLLTSIVTRALHTV
ncbi:MAG: hypothetical protein QOE76_886 [Frankiales bacterium]|nr:hypothetical protein [Frankiales bacterium]